MNIKKTIISLVSLIVIAFGLIPILAFNSKMEFTPPDTKHVIVMVGTAKWCPLCQANGKRVKTEVVSQFIGDDSYTIIINDLSDDSTRAQSKLDCAAVGIDKFAKKHSSTGMIYFINSKNITLISKISVTEPNDSIKQAFRDALNKI